LVQENVRFCILSTRMEDALAVSPLLEEHERHSLEALYLEWYRHSSVQLHSPHALPTNESPGVTVLKNVMRWRYLSNRVILHRPVLLWYAMRKQMTWETLSPEKKGAIERCREVCDDLINDIAATWRGQKACQMSGWNATWLLYQAAMVPLLSLYSDPFDLPVVRLSRHQVEIAMQVMRDLQGWSTTARRSLEVITRLYEASGRHSVRVYEQRQQRHHHHHHQDLYSSTNTPASVSTSTSASTPAPSFLQQHQHHHHHQPQQQQLSPTSNFQPGYIDVSFANAHGTPQFVHTSASQEMFMDNMFDSLRWSNSWDSPIGGPPMMNGWDYDAMQNWAGNPQAEEYFDLGFGMVDVESELPDPRQLDGFDLDLQPTAPTSSSQRAAHSTDLMNGQFDGRMDHRHSL